MQRLASKAGFLLYTAFSTTIPLEALRWRSVAAAIGGVNRILARQAGSFSGAFSRRSDKILLKDALSVYFRGVRRAKSVLSPLNSPFAYLRMNADSRPSMYRMKRAYSTQPPPEDEKDDLEEEVEGESKKKEESKNSVIVATHPADDKLSLFSQMPTPERVIVYPVYNKPIFPGEVLTEVIYNQTYINAIVSILKTNTPHVIGLFFATDKEREDLRRRTSSKDRQAAASSVTSLDQIHHQGVLALITDATYLQNQQGLKVKFFALRRLRITETAKAAPFFTVKVEDIREQPFTLATNKELKSLTNELMATLMYLLQYDVAGHYRVVLSELAARMNYYNPVHLADIAAALATHDAAAKQQEILAEADFPRRLQKVLLLLRHELETVKLQWELSQSIQSKIDKSNRRMYLMEQLKLIKKELGLDQDHDTMLEKYEERLKGLHPPEHALKAIREEMAKFATLEPSSMEYSITRNYLDWLTQLPWGVHSPDKYDLAHARTVLDEDHYGLKDIKDRILEFIAVGKIKGSVQGKILCFVGPPGVGKTSIGKSIARALGREFYRFSVGGLHDVAEIKGHRRTYIGAMPGKLIQALKLVKTSNPVILIDEIDKLGQGGWHGDPSAALLEVLDPVQNAAFTDHYLDVPFDLSKVLFVCTANVVDTIPKPLQDRMEVLRLSGYVAEEKMEIAKKYLIPETREATGLKVGDLHISDTALKDLITNYCREAGVRNLQKHIEKIYRKAALKVAEHSSTTKGKKRPLEKLTVTEENLAEYVGQPVFTSEKIYETTPPGVVMGLAWTALGGSTLYIESVAERSEKATLRCTGQMGAVMKESTDIAYTYAKNIFERVSPGSRFFDHTAIHMHIPEGATPKDGPSAGITMVTSLLSLALNRPARQDVAMTGELTLTGKVLPIGGVKEKTIAAKRSGVKLLIFPKENKKDWDELADYIKKGFEVCFVSHYDDVFRIVFPDVPLSPPIPVPAVATAPATPPITAVPPLKESPPAKKRRIPLSTAHSGKERKNK